MTLTRRQLLLASVAAPVAAVVPDLFTEESPIFAWTINVDDLPDIEIIWIDEPDPHEWTPTKGREWYQETFEERLDA